MPNFPPTLGEPIVIEDSVRVVSGVARAINPTSSGRSVTAGFYPPGFVIPAGITSAAFQVFLSSGGRVEDAGGCPVPERQAVFHARFLTLRAMPAGERVVGFLQLAAEYGALDEEDNVWTFSQEVLALDVDLTRESVARILRALRAEGRIETGYNWLKWLAA